MLNLLLFCMTIYLLQSSRTIQRQSELTNGNELNEQLYQKMFKNLEYGTILLEVVTILTIFDILTSFNVFITKNSVLIIGSLFPYVALAFILYG
ncbi:hypothetical protein [Streptococcus anginosus]|uniref:hypothetical protein n=1 Tax=Streptococcus anginosus TaxID=1328 RepID=UPI003081D314